MQWWGLVVADIPWSTELTPPHAYKKTSMQNDHVCTYHQTWSIMIDLYYIGIIGCNVKSIAICPLIYSSIVPGMYSIALGVRVSIVLSY